MALHSDLDLHLRKVVGNTGFSTSGASATFPTSSMDHRRLQELIDLAALIKHEVVLNAGVLTVRPR